MLRAMEFQSVLRESLEIKGSRGGKHQQKERVDLWKTSLAGAFSPF